jgi:hypothetical protein
VIHTGFWEPALSLTMGAVLGRTGNSLGCGTQSQRQSLLEERVTIADPNCRPTYFPIHCHLEAAAR